MTQRVYTAIDLFAGIGGIRMGFESKGRVRTIFSSEIDKQAAFTYETNFGHKPHGDITKIDEKDIPSFDILYGGFPCQAFSIAGKRGGFSDTRGTLFFDVARIIKHHQPKAFLLENVKGLMNHDKGKTLQTILNVLQNDLGYKVYHKLINAADHGVPQKRQRIYFAGFKDHNVDFTFPENEPLTRFVGDILETEQVSSKYYLSEQYLSTLKAHRARHESKGNGFGYEIIAHDGIANTLVTGGMGRERNLVIDLGLTDFTPKTRIKGPINTSFIRKMTPREWARLQGFPDSFQIPVADGPAYKQFGNSVCVSVIKKLADNIIAQLDAQG